jgi:hypothetical protein
MVHVGHVGEFPVVLANLERRRSSGGWCLDEWRA